jgi:hypothetical protein
MEVHELKEVINQRFEDLSKNLTSCFKSIDDKNTLTDKEIAAIKNTLISHDRWLWLMRGIGLVLVTALSYIGIKIRF